MADRPQNFGYKCAWLAVRATSPQEVAAALGLTRVEPINWKDGVSAAYEERVFVTPLLRGWILAASNNLPTPGDKGDDQATALLAKLGHRFSEVQYFATHRIVEFHAWARLVDGKFVRKFACTGDGAVDWNAGSDFAAELQLGLRLTEPLEQWKKTPDEDAVMAIARAWSVDPSTLESQGFSEGLGLVGNLTR